MLSDAHAALSAGANKVIPWNVTVLSRGINLLEDELCCAGSGSSCGAHTKDLMGHLFRHKYTKGGFVSLFLY